MVVIFGFGPGKQEDLGEAVQIVCPNGHNQVMLHHVRSKKTVRLYFVPVVPYGTDDYLVCPVCSRGMQLSQAQVPHVAPVKRATAAFRAGRLSEADYAAQADRFWRAMGVHVTGQPVAGSPAGAPAPPPPAAAPAPPPPLLLPRRPRRQMRHRGWRSCRSWQSCTRRASFPTLTMSQPSAASSTRGSRRGDGARRCFVLAVAVLVVFTIARSYGLLGPLPVAVGLLSVALILVAWTGGLTRADLGLGWREVPAGLGYGAGAAGFVLLVLLVAALIPATNGFLHDSRAAISGGRLGYDLGVSIVLLTAIPEEFAFRGVLLGSGLKLWGPWRASLVTSVLFGLWHIAPTLGTMSDNHEFKGAAASVAGQSLLVLGAIAVTFAAGLIFCWLRLKSTSLIAPVMAHAATNGLALTVAWFTVHHASLLTGR